VQLGPNRELKVWGTGGNDTILMGEFGPFVVVVGLDGQGRVTRRAEWIGRLRSLSVRGLTGNDLVVNLTRLPSDVGTGPGNDIVVGGSDSDEIKAGPGRDVVVGRAGLGFIEGNDDADILVGGPDVEYMEGNDGADVVWGRADFNLMLGGAGNDILVGGPDQDEILGQGGDDALWGLAGTDGLSGGDGNDVLCGGPQNDVLSGGAGNDFLYGEEDADSHDGDLGQNELYGSALLGDTFANGNHNPDALCLPPGGPGGGPEEVTTLANGALLIRSPGGLVLAGTPGTDWLRIEASRERILLSGNLSGSDGPLRMELPRHPSGERLYVDAQGGDDRVVVVGRLDAILLEGGNGDDELDTQGAESGAVVLMGGAGADVLRAGRSGTVLAGEDGDDVLVPGAAPDLVSTGPGRDKVRAPEGVGTVLERWRPEDRVRPTPP
jgi:Ca2+-binding RTX toxin-like protein